MQLHISNDRPAPQSLPDGVKWCPAVGKMADGTTNDWPIVPDAAWAERLCFNVPVNHSGLLLIDNETKQLTDIYSGNGTVREKAIDAMRKQVNAVWNVRRHALAGCYAGPSAMHQWPSNAYIDDAYSFGRTGELLNRCKAIFPLCYLVSPERGQHHHYDALMRMAMAAHEEYGMRVAPCVSPRDWGNGELNSVNCWDAFTECVETIAAFQPSDLVLWEAEEYFIRMQREKSVNRPLNESELAACKEIAQANNDKAIEIVRRYA